jgi:hypothetical protein
MDGSISRVRLSDGSFRYRARYRDPGGRQHERRFPRKVDAQRWLDEAASAMVTQTWTAPSAATPVAMTTAWETTRRLTRALQ